jgi:hypothetical protein
MIARAHRGQDDEGQYRGNDQGAKAPHTAAEENKHPDTLPVRRVASVRIEHQVSDQMEGSPLRPVMRRHELPRNAWCFSRSSGGRRALEGPINEKHCVDLSLLSSDQHPEGYWTFLRRYVRRN